MKVSKYVLINSYGVTLNHFFETRNDRNTYFANYPAELSETGLLCAIGADVATVGENDEVWDLERYNGTNWTVQSVDPNYSLVITSDGIEALSNINTGTYNLEITAIKIKQNHIVNPSKSLMAWTKEDFEADGDIILDSETNANFSIENNLSWRTNMANGGIQYTIRIDTNTYGETNGTRYDDYTVGCVGLYMNDPNEPTRKVLFAIGNLNANIPKYTTTSTRVGNAIKLLLNTVITNLGYVSDLTLFKESVNSIPEVENEIKLVEDYGTTVSPYNFYLVNNYSGTNIPALAARKGDPAKGEVTWQYFTPRDDVLDVNDSQIDSELYDYMVATWDKNTGKFVKATARSGSGSTNNLTGIKVGNNIIFAGNVSCFDTGTSFDISISVGGSGYKAGDLLVFTSADPDPIIEFKVMVKNVNVAGEIEEISVVSITGIGAISISGAEFTYDPSTPAGEATGSGFLANISSIGSASNTYVWDFPGGPGVGDTKDWYNLPLYVDKNWSSASQANWEAYCDEVGFDAAKEPKDRRGKLTIKENDYFVGWCTGTAAKSSIKLAMDLGDQASETDYGTTRYATNEEVREKTSGIDQVTTVTPQTAFNNYLQRSLPTTGAGSAWNNRLSVDSYVQFNTTLVGKGATPTQEIMSDSNLSFFGTAYRARWGDLAEYYRSDKVYPSGTLITMGCGSAEITQAITECNGIISERPGYELGEKKDAKDLPVALVGKVPVIFDGKCKPTFGDRVYLSQTEPGKASTIAYGKCLGKIIDKGKDLGSQGTVLCSVRISF